MTLYLPIPKNLHRGSKILNEKCKTEYFSVKVNRTLKYTRSFSTCPILLSDSVSDPDRSVSEDSSVSDENSDRDLSEREDEKEEESSAELAQKWNGNMSGFLEYSETKMQKLAQQSKDYITKFRDDRSKDRNDVESSELKKYDEDTKEEINSQREFCSTNLNRLASVRDDVLDQMPRHEGDYGSDYESDTEGHTAQYNNIDPSFANFTQSYNTEVDNIISSVDEESSRTPSLKPDLQKETNDSVSAEQGSSKRKREESEDIPETKKVKMEDSSVESVEQSSSKRKREESEDITDTKKVKMEDSSDKSASSDKDTRSPLDYVIDKQQEAGYDFSDDVD